MEEEKECGMPETNAPLFLPASPEASMKPEPFSQETMGNENIYSYEYSDENKMEDSLRYPYDLFDEASAPEESGKKKETYFGTLTIQMILCVSLIIIMLCAKFVYRPAYEKGTEVYQQQVKQQVDFKKDFSYYKGKIDQFLSQFSEKEASSSSPSDDDAVSPDSDSSNEETSAEEPDVSSEAGENPVSQPAADSLSPTDSQTETQAEQPQNSDPSGDLVTA